MKDFKKLKIWQKGMELVKQVYELVAQFPSDERFGLKSQMTRAVISIPSNIAEGSSKRTTKHYLTYLEIALGSSYELETQTLIADDLAYGDKKLRELVIKNIDEEQKMLQGFIKTVEG